MQRQSRLNWLAMLVGAAVTATCAVLYLGGGFEFVEAKTLDWRFRVANSIPQSADIVCIDINDGSLEEIGRWPWPRDIQAGLISALDELGARAVLVDLEWNEPQPFRPRKDDDSDLIEGPSEDAQKDREELYPDLELQAAVAQAGMVYVASSTRPLALESAEEFNAAVDAYATSDKHKARAALDALAARRRHSAAGRQATDTHIPERAQLVAALERAPGAALEALAAKLELDPGVVSEAEFQRARVAAYGRILRDWLQTTPEAREQFAFDIFPQQYENWTRSYVGNISGERHAWMLACRAALGQDATLRDPLVRVEQVASVAMPVEGLVPTYYMIGRAARRRGFVFFEPDPDGVVRRLPMFQRFGDVAVSQLAFTLAFDLLNLKPADLEVRDHVLHLRPPGRDELFLQLDNQGRALVPWVSERQWLEQFKEHIGAQQLWRIGNNRARLDFNRAAVAATLPTLLNLPEFAHWKETLDALAAERTLAEQIQQRWFARQFELLGDLREQLQEIRTAIDTACDEILASPLSSQPASRPALVTGLLETLRSARNPQAKIAEQIHSDLELLRRKIRGKICLIGYTATSLADIKPTPTGPSIPGVSAHANMLNGLLTGRLVHWIHPLWNLLFIVVVGGIVSYLSTMWRPGSAAIAVVAVLVPYVSVACLLFYYQTLWITLAPVITAGVASFLAVTLFRLVFLDREQRQLTTALSQYTSKQIARQMAENPELCKIAEMRDVSAMFTDLKGFTGISEKIGAQRTQKLLNICLHRFTQVMLRHEAMVNKFLGDGVFAFWNPVIYPQPQHATQACRSALELQTALEDLKREQQATGGDDAFVALSLRVGLAAGQAIVGPCGSEEKYDYTCIGDTVNLASRLESANKFFGTGILVNEEVRNAVDGEFTFRPLGGVQVKGKLRAVQVFELLGAAGQTPAEQLAYAEQFERGVRHFQKREWVPALTAFDACLRERPDDAAAQQYAVYCRQFQEEPPGADWNGGIELTEK